MRIAVVDGQGGGIGRALVEKLKRELSGDHEIIGLGTNSTATTQMLKAGADDAATGENAIVYNARKADVIVGAMGIIISNAMMGELTPRMACAISESPAKKVLIPLNRCNIEVAGVKNESLPGHIEDAICIIKEYLSSQKT